MSKDNQVKKKCINMFLPSCPVMFTTNTDVHGKCKGKSHQVSKHSFALQKQGKYSTVIQDKVHGSLTMHSNSSNNPTSGMSQSFTASLPFHFQLEHPWLYLCDCLYHRQLSLHLILSLHYLSPFAIFL